jgi:protein O-mannosyl-transferase
LGVDTVDNGEKHQGVDPKYRPRSYNEGPKETTAE